MDEKYALLWSHQSNALHVEPLVEAMRKGQSLFVRNQANDYILMAIGSKDEAYAAAERLRSVLISRDKGGERQAA